MTEQEYDNLIEAMKAIAWHTTGTAIHQKRAGNIEEILEEIKERFTFTE